MGELGDGELMNNSEHKGMITIDLNELLALEAQGTLKNLDFTRIWTDVVCMPMYRIEYILANSKHTADGYDLDQAFYYGQLNRIRAYLSYERRIVCAQLMNMELSSIFNRVILEDNITLQYFIRHPDKLDDYRKSAFKAEKEFEEIIYKKREERKEIGKEDPLTHDWEDRMLRSIHRAYATIGYNAEDAKNTKLPKAPQILDMARNVDLEIMYTTYRLECHSTHGDWFDISRYFLEEKDGRFFPRFKEDGVDIRKLNPILQIVYKSLVEFLSIVVGHGLNIAEELEGDLRIIKAFDMMHHNFLNHRALMTDINERQSS